MSFAHYKTQPKEHPQELPIIQVNLANQGNRVAKIFDEIFLKKIIIPRRYIAENLIDIFKA